VAVANDPPLKPLLERADREEQAYAVVSYLFSDRPAHEDFITSMAAEAACELELARGA
jgi:hypothetical protein